MTFTTYAIIHGIEEDTTVIIGSYDFVDQAAKAADQNHNTWPNRSLWIVNNETGKKHCQWVGGEAPESTDDDRPHTRASGPFRSLAGMVYTECPCGCGSKTVCDQHRIAVKARNNALPF